MLRNSVLFASVGLLGVALGSGCSGSTTSDGAQPVPADQFVERVVSAVCDNVGPCCQSAGFPYDPAACKALGNSDLSASYALGNPNVDYDAVAAGKCVAAISDLVRSCGAVDLDGLEQCDLVLVGKLPAGAACQKSVECAAPAGGNAYCDQGACVTEPRGTAGDAQHDVYGARHELGVHRRDQLRVRHRGLLHERRSVLQRDLQAAAGHR